MPDGDDPYLRENFQRNSISRGLKNSTDNDLIIIFGRHRGATLQQLRDTDEKYLNWLVSPNGPFQDDDRERIRNHINM